MILGCPECQTRFAIDAQALRPDGRRVKCGKCGHVWFEEPPEPSEVEPLSVTPLEPDELSHIPTPNLPALTVADQRRTAGAAWVMVVLLLAAVLALGWFGRASIARAWPPAEALYGMVGIPAFPPPGEGLTINLEVKRVGDHLDLRGGIVNTTDRALGVPPLYGVLWDAEGKQLRHWQFDIKPVILGPGETLPFSDTIDNPPDNIKDVSALFTNPAEN